MNKPTSLVRAAQLLAICLAMSIAPTTIHAKNKKIGWNIQRAAKVMEAVPKIGKRNQNDEIREILAPYKVTHFKAFNDAYAGKIDFLLATSPTRVYIAFRGTQTGLKDNEHLNFAGLPIRPADGRFGAVHVGWWTMAKTAYLKEIQHYLKRHAKGKKILVMGSSQGGAIAAYTARHIQSDLRYRSYPLRLVTFGAPRYTDNPLFFRMGKNVDFWVFTVEMTKRNRCVDKKVYAWQKYVMHLRLTAPLNRSGDKVWHGRCMRGDLTNYDAVHDLDEYQELAKTGICRHIALRLDCKETKWAVSRAVN